MRTERNIRLGMVLVGLNNLFFWMAPWLLFMLRYINFGQVAVIQAIGLGTRVLAELPSGALADLLGKKKTLIVSFLLTSIGEALMIVNPSYEMFAVSFVVINLGYSFYSGTMDAFLYDTLVSDNQESRYPRVLSRQNAIMNGAVAVASIVGGLAYSVWIFLPWIMTVIAKLIGLGVAFFVDEPLVDTDTFSWSGFVGQARKGFRHLFSRSLLRSTLLLLTFGIFHTVAYELLDDAAVVAFGYGAVGIGVLYSIATLITIPFSLLYERVSKRFASFTLLVGAIGVLVLNYILTPWIGISIWTGLFLIRVMYSPIKEGAVAELINTRTPSNIRATTISTYELIRKLPYLFLAGFIGSLMDAYGVKWLAFYLAFLLALLSLPQVLLGFIVADKRRSSDADGE
jgi:MFS family permease